MSTLARSGRRDYGIRVEANGDSRTRRAGTMSREIVTPPFQTEQSMDGNGPGSNDRSSVMELETDNGGWDLTDHGSDDSGRRNRMENVDRRQGRHAPDVTTMMVARGYRPYYNGKRRGPGGRISEGISVETEGVVGSIVIRRTNDVCQVSHDSTR